MNEEVTMEFMKKKLEILVLSTILLVAVFVSLPVKASEFNFAVETKLPKNQVDKQKTYFHLEVKPKQKQTLTIKLRNDTNKPVIINPKINSATTNMNGVVEYGESSKQKNKTLPYNMADLIKVKSKVTIPAKGSYNLPLTLKVPEKPFQGILAGGITLEENKKERTNEGNGLKIENKYAYVVGIILQEAKPQVTQNLELLRVKAGQVNARNVIKATLQNPTSTYLNKFEIKEARITRKGSNETMYESSKKDMQVAPNSDFDYPIALNGEKLVAGDYTLYLKASSSKDSWTFKQNFTINKKEAKEYNAQDVNIPEPNYFWWYVAGGTLIFLGIVLVIILLVRRKKKKKRVE